MNRRGGFEGGKGQSITYRDLKPEIARREQEKPSDAQESQVPVVQDEYLPKGRVLLLRGAEVLAKSEDGERERYDDQADHETKRKFVANLEQGRAQEIPNALRIDRGRLGMSSKTRISVCFLTFREFFQPVSRDTRRKSRVFLPSGVTSFVTVFPPSFVRSFAMPANICAMVLRTVLEVRRGCASVD